MRESQIELALNDELQCSMTLIKGGLYQLHKYCQPDDSLFVGMRLLSDGLERFFKVVLLLKFLNDNGRWMTELEFCKNGLRTHDLNKLFDLMKLLPFDTSSPAIQNDIEFFNDPFLRKVLNTLSEFSEKARYHNINVLIGKTEPDAESAIDKLEELKMQILSADKKLFKRFTTASLSANASREVYRRIIALFERLVRAIARLFTLSPCLGSLGYKYSLFVHDFLLLADEELGHCKYWRNHDN
jgi:hypothetical protein